MGEMETNRQQKTARGLVLLLGADGHAAKLAIGQCCKRSLERTDERTANCAAERNQGAFGTLAALRPVMRTIASALQPLLVSRCVAVNWGGTKLALATVRMVRAAAAHHQVNYQQRDAQDARQCAHTTPCSLLFAIGDEVSLPLAEVV
jgi:hypothetical protein